MRLPSALVRSHHILPDISVRRAAIIAGLLGATVFPAVFLLAVGLAGTPVGKGGIAPFLSSAVVYLAPGLAPANIVTHALLFVYAPKLMWTWVEWASGSVFNGLLWAILAGVGVWARKHFRPLMWGVLFLVTGFWALLGAIRLLIQHIL